MARAIGQGYAILGVMPCLACTKEMPAKKTAGGKLSLCCTWCDFSAYIGPGTKAHELLIAKVKLEAPAPAGAAPSSPAAAASSSTSTAEQAPPADKKPQDKAPPAPRRSGPLFGGS